MMKVIFTGQNFNQNSCLHSSDFVMTQILQDCIISSHEAWAMTGFPVIVVGTTDHMQLPIKVQSCFNYEINFEVCNTATVLV